jgi:hypothetical protein
MRVALACAAPVLVLGAVWLLVTQVLMVPAVPDQSTPADRVAQFIMHPEGLPRLGGERREAFIQQQVRRLVQDEPFRRRFLAEYRVSSPEEQKAFREHLFDAFKPLVMRDIRAFHDLSQAERGAYLDDRIVAYNRLNAFWGRAGIVKSDLGPAAPGPDELLGLLLQKTTEQERQMGVAYAAALQARVNEILADPALKQEFETRIGLPQP